jgi:hypothetical protein
LQRIKREVKLDKEDVDWFETTYPHASFSWMFTLTLKEFRALHTKTPADYVKLGAAELKRIIDENQANA